MSRLRSKPTLLVITLCGLVCIEAVWFIIFKPTSLKAQNAETVTIRKNIRRAKYQNEPYEFTNMTFKRPSDYQGPEMPNNEKGNVNTPNDWLRGFAFTLKNISEKPIVWVRVRFVFPKTEDHPNLGFDTYLGRRDPKSTYFNEMILEPSETIEFVLSDKEFQRLKNFVTRAGAEFEKLSGVELEIQALGFSDKTKWDTGDMYEPDPENPDKYRKLPIK